MIVGAGKVSGSMDASNILKPALADGELSVIAATTYDEYRNIFSKDKALERRFQKIDVVEPDIDQTYEILKGLKPIYEKGHNVIYTDEALYAAAKLAKRYMLRRHLPDCAIDLIDEAGASIKAKAESKKDIKTIDLTHIQETVAKVARIPDIQASQDDRVVLRRLEGDLKGVVFGQDEAIEKVSSAIKLARSGLKDEEKPIGCFLFEGPTGVGKTEIAKQLAKVMGLHFERFDMSEYMERHTVSRLIGSPPGYVGFDQGGLLTEAVNKNPYSVVLLDEIEKAHPDVFNILLQVMDYGRLTDNVGAKADFGNVVLIMTTNAGSGQNSRPIGFTSSEPDRKENEEINRLFTPEFRNRLDAIVPFNPLEPKLMANIVDKFMTLLQEQVKPKGVEITLDEKGRKWLADEGYNRELGARPLGRVIDEHIKKPLANELLFGSLQHGGSLTISSGFNSSANDNEKKSDLLLEFREEARKVKQEDSPELKKSSHNRPGSNGPV
jgi:ATP-dependent Clp protease ATP-binding subunit ClpA